MLQNSFSQVWHSRIIQRLDQLDIII